MVTGPAPHLTLLEFLFEVVDLLHRLGQPLSDLAMVL